VLPLVCDLTQRHEVELLVRSVEREFSSIDVLINNAGIIQVGPLEEMEIEDYEEAMKVNFWGALYVTLAISSMKAVVFHRDTRHYRCLFR
jgi:NAD(P)-dependent dehydrogenase (short-subunit alcohol dehydrogenase family)